MRSQETITVIITDIKRLTFIAAASSVLQFFIGKVIELEFIHFFMVYCSLAIVSMFLFRRRLESSYSVLLFLGAGSIFAGLRYFGVSIMLGSTVLGLLLLVCFGTITVLGVIFLDLLLSKNLDNRDNPE